MIYQSVNTALLAQVPPQAREVLDVGCGGGALGERLKAERSCRVVGITHDAGEADQARQVLDDVVVADLDRYDPAPLGRFDLVICCHVLEHLVAPERLLAALHANLRPHGTLLVALPNVLFWRQRLEFLRGRFRYTDGGLMDRTHVRFFDWVSANGALRDGGFEVTHGRADGGLPLSRRLGRRLSARLDRAALTRWPGLFGHQFVYACRPAGARV
jgi:SAM-dependent methyltransferase